MQKLQRVDYGLIYLYIQHMWKKKELMDLLQQSLRKALVEIERNRDEAQAESNRHIGRMESRYDTFKEESQYLADSHEGTARTLRKALQTLDEYISQGLNKANDEIRLGSVITVAHLNQKKRFLMYEFGGGTNLVLDGEEYIVISPESSLGKALQGKRISDTVSFDVNNKKADYTILAIM